MVKSICLFLLILFSCKSSVDYKRELDEKFIEIEQYADSAIHTYNYIIASESGQHLDSLELQVNRFHDKISITLEDITNLFHSGKISEAQYDQFAVEFEGKMNKVKLKALELDSLKIEIKIE